MRQLTPCHYRLKVSSVHQFGFHLCRHCNHRLRGVWNTQQPSLIVECNTCSRRPPYESRNHLCSSQELWFINCYRRKQFSWKNPIPLELLQSMLGPPWTATRSTKESTNIFLCIKNQIFWLPLSKQQASLAPLWLFSNCVQQNEPRLELVTRLPALCCWSPCSASSSPSSSLSSSSKSLSSC